MTTLTIVNVDHVLHVGNVGKGDKVDKLIFLTTKISTILTNKVDKLIFSTTKILSILALCAQSGLLRARKHGRVKCQIYWFWTSFNIKGKECL